MSKLTKFITFIALTGIYWFILFKVFFTGELPLMALLSFMGPIGLYTPILILLLFSAPVLIMILVQTIKSFSKVTKKDRV